MFESFELLSLALRLRAINEQAGEDSESELRVGIFGFRPLGSQIQLFLSHK